MLKLYKTLVCPHLEYYVSACSPHYAKEVLLERVQYRLTRMIPGPGKICYKDRLEYLGLWTLEERRNRSDLLEVFKMFKGLSLTPFNHFFTLNTSANTRGHSAKIVMNRCRLDLRLFFFSERATDRWNGLHQWIIDSLQWFPLRTASSICRTWGWATSRTDGPPSHLASLVLECRRNRCGAAPVSY